MRHYSREELLELAPAYAVGATSPEENAAIEAAMPTSPELVAEVASFREVAADLAQQQRMAPSPSVRADFLNGVAAGKVAALPVATPRASSRPPMWMSIALVASVVLAVALGVQNQGLKKSSSDLETALAAATAEAEKRNEQLNAILEGDQQLHLVQLKTADTATGPGIQFFWNVKQRRALAHAFKLKPAPNGRTYQVWLLKDGKPLGVGTFNSDPDGHALALNFTLPEGIDGVTDVLVTEEPAGGSPQPTTAPLIGGKMRAGP